MTEESSTIPLYSTQMEPDVTAKMRDGVILRTPYNKVNYNANARCSPSARPTRHIVGFRICADCD